jgi:DNA-binding GntR family transcriptional regulator
MATSLETQAYEEIKQAIFTKELKPGEKVSQNDWVDRLNISRTPVRDALKRLEYEGLIIRDTERLWHVYTLTIEDVRRLYEIRESVEGYLAFLAAQNFREEHCKKVRAILQKMESFKGATDHDGFDAENHKFHALIIEAAANPYMVEIIHQVDNKLHRLRPKGVHLEGRLERAFEENKGIAEAMIEHNPEKTEQLQRAHLRSSYEYLMLLLTRIIIPFTGPEF